MNIVITSGGTSENIDCVRKITNSSSGKLGSIIANKFLKNRKVKKIFYVCSKKAILPKKSKKMDIIYISNTNSVKETVENILKNNNIDIFIHSMAVSDFTIENVIDYSLLKNKLQHNSNLDEVLLSIDKIDKSKKISSSTTPILFLKQTPKIISLIKSISPKTYLVGFKLLNNSSYDELLSASYKLMNDNDCDLVVANDLCNIDKTKHYAYVIDKSNNIFF